MKQRPDLIVQLCDVTLRRWKAGTMGTVQLTEMGFNSLVRAFQSELLTLGEGNGKNTDTVDYQSMFCETQT